MFNLEKVHYILDEMIMNGYVYETNKQTITRQSPQGEGLEA